jgi:hypothetical protein
MLFLTFDNRTLDAKPCAILSHLAQNSGTTDLESINFGPGWFVEERS